jgi:predicted RNA methylase
MFNQDFYPTPEEVIHQMIGIHDLQDKVILEPHGGSGNIIDVLKTHNPKEIIACEINPKLAVITSSKANRFLKYDFLDVNSTEISHIDFIIANPPFSTGAKQILHMFEVAPPGCIILTLCNSDSIRFSHHYKDSSELYELIEEYGFKEHLGRCFDTSERETKVDVSFITLIKPKGESNDEFDGYFDMTEESWPEGEGITTFNSIQAIINRIVSSVKLFNNAIDSGNAVNNAMGNIGHNIAFGAYKTDSKGNHISISRETFKKELQKNAWLHIFDKLNMDKYITKSVRSTINKFVEQQSHIPFTMKNVSIMINNIVGTHAERMDNMLVEAFDKICSFADSNNSSGETWKTNSNYRINKKFIHPWMCNYCSIMKYDKVHLSHYAEDEFQDIMKAMCHLTGIDYNKTSSLYSFVNGYHFHNAVHNGWMEWGKWYEWGFFRIKGYKKGTMHFQFVDDKVWEQFNRKVAELKGWQLPQETDRKQDGTARDKSKGKETMPELFNNDNW